ncbi:MAG: hypothetical protein KME21_19570 [Desmonostoc vinosum HA7617-LM4]|nr:hypothetical protein [Desmonostoc vinosum HA7617-LM4]
MGTGDWGLGIGDWGLGIGDWELRGRGDTGNVNESFSASPCLPSPCLPSLRLTSSLLPTP